MYVMLTIVWDTWLEWLLGINGWKTITNIRTEQRLDNVLSWLVFSVICSLNTLLQMCWSSFFLSSTSWYSWVCWFWCESFSEIHRRHPEKTSGPKVPKGTYRGLQGIPVYRLIHGHSPHLRLGGGGMIFIGVPGLRSGGWRNQDFGWNLATFGYIWLPWSGLLQPTLDRCCLFSRICVFASAHFPSWYLGCWEQPWWFGVGQALELTIWQRLLGKYSWGLPLRNSDCDIISIHVHCPNRGIISKHKGYSHINGRDTMAQGILDLRVYILTQENW